MSRAIFLNWSYIPGIERDIRISLFASKQHIDLNLESGNKNRDQQTTTGDPPSQASTRNTMSLAVGQSMS